MPGPTGTDSIRAAGPAGRLRPLPSPLAREALLCAFGAAGLAALLVWLGPPGTDLAAHAYQRALLLKHGFSLWNNFWYAGRYSFVTYSIAYYPLAALFGIKPLAVTTVAAAALAFAILLEREWGATARWSGRTFAVVWAGIVLSAAFPFTLGIALALLALCALQARGRWRFAALAVATLAASPVAFVLLVLLVGGIALARRQEWRRFGVPAVAIASAAAFEAALWRIFPDPGRFPFSAAELAAACTFCVLGIGLAAGVEGARVLRWIFAVYLVACITVFLVPSPLGENVARLRFAAVPLAVLLLSLRHWRPRVVAVGALALAVSWNVTPLAASFRKSTDDPSAKAAYWSPAVTFLKNHLTPSYRVEAVDTTGHWAAYYLARAGIPLARGWFRQDDFPENRLLYRPLAPTAYGAWLKRLGVRYVVLTGATPDYSARREAALVASGRSGLRLAYRFANGAIYVMPSARSIVTGPGSPEVLTLTQDRVALSLPEAGTYRLAVRSSPYWHASTGCVTAGGDGMIRVHVPRPETVMLRFRVGAADALNALAGIADVC